MLEAGILPFLLAAMGADVTDITERGAAAVKDPTAVVTHWSPEDKKAASVLIAELSVHPLGRRELQLLAQEQARRKQELADKVAKAKGLWSKAGRGVSLAKRLGGFIAEDQADYEADAKRRAQKVAESAKHRKRNSAMAVVDGVTPLVRASALMNPATATHRRTTAPPYRRTAAPPYHRTTAPPHHTHHPSPHPTRRR